MKCSDSFLVGRVIPNAPRRLGDKPPYLPSQSQYFIAGAIRESWIGFVTVAPIVFLNSSDASETENGQMKL